MTKKMKTTKRDFELFKKECLKWQDRLELGNYDILFEWEDIEPKGFDVACSQVYPDYNATLTLDTICDENISPDRIKRAAKHEMMHIFVGRLTTCGYNRFTSKSELYESEEEVVRKLCKLVK